MIGLCLQIWDTLKGQLQTEFADITANDALGVRSESERGHLSLDYKCMKWVQLESKVPSPEKLNLLFFSYTFDFQFRYNFLYLNFAEEKEEGWELTTGVGHREW